MRISNIALPLAIASLATPAVAAAAEALETAENLPLPYFLNFVPSNRLSKRSCGDCTDASNMQVDKCGLELSLDRSRTPELLECACNLPQEYFDDMMACLTGCEQLQYSPAPNDPKDGQDLKVRACAAAEDIKTYTGDYEDYTYIPSADDEAMTEAVSVTKTNVSNHTGSTSTTATSSNSASVLGAVSMFALVALSLL